MGMGMVALPIGGHDVWRDIWANASINSLTTNYPHRTTLTETRFVESLEGVPVAAVALVVTDAFSATRSTATHHALALVYVCRRARL